MLVLILWILWLCKWKNRKRKRTKVFDIGNRVTELKRSLGRTPSKTQWWQEDQGCHWGVRELAKGTWVVRAARWADDLVAVGGKNWMRLAQERGDLAQEKRGLYPAVGEFGLWMIMNASEIDIRLPESKCLWYGGWTGLLHRPSTLTVYGRPNSDLYIICYLNWRDVVHLYYTRL